LDTDASATIASSWITGSPFTLARVATLIRQGGRIKVFEVRTERDKLETRATVNKCCDGCRTRRDRL
jgi:hypothetical protein